MRKKVNHSDSRGFTLLEVMVTMTIFAVMLLIISGAFRMGLTAWDRGEQTREEYQRQRTATQLITRQVKSMVPYKIKTQKAEGDYLAFEGKTNSLKFVSTLSLRALRPNGFVFAIYEYKEGGAEGGRFVAYEKRVVNKDFFEEGPKEEEGVTVLEGLSDVQFEYFREEDTEKTRTEAWLADWNAKEEKSLPTALRMKITFKNGKSEQEETSLTLLSSIAARRYEEVKAGPATVQSFGRRSVRERLQGQGTGPGQGQGTGTGMGQGRGMGLGQ
jgi:general secretion pathway protein J